MACARRNEFEGYLQDHTELAAPWQTHTAQCAECAEVARDYARARAAARLAQPAAPNWQTMQSCVIQQIHTGSRPAMPWQTVLLSFAALVLAVLGWYGRPRHDAAAVNAIAHDIVPVPAMPQGIPPLRLLQTFTGEAPQALVVDMRNLEMILAREGDPIGAMTLRYISDGVVEIDTNGAMAQLERAASAAAWQPYADGMRSYYENRLAAVQLTADDVTSMIRWASLGDAAMLALLQRAALQHDTVGTAAETALAGGLGGMAQVQQLIQKADASERNVRCYAIQALARLDSPLVKQYFRNALTRPDEPLAHLLAEAAATQGDLLCLEPLQQMASSGHLDERTRAVIARAMAQLREHGR